MMWASSIEAEKKKDNRRSFDFAQDDSSVSLRSF